MPVHDELGKRMKEYYEQIPKYKLMRRTPVILRIDGKAFHTFTRGFAKPFDEVLMTTMQRTMQYLCENIQGCVLGYAQSDEISLLLIDYKKFNSEAWFDYEVQKLCSISASMATMAFNKFFEEEFNNWGVDALPDWYEGGTNKDLSAYSNELKLCRAYEKSMRSAMFDSRCFNIPKEEVANYFYWRQLDATRNSIQMVGQANFSHKELHGKSCNMIQDMLHELKGIDWNDFTAPEKRGTCCIKKSYVSDGIERSKWVIDENIPIFRGDGRQYIEYLLDPNEV